MMTERETALPTAKMNICPRGRSSSRTLKFLKNLCVDASRFENSPGPSDEEPGDSVSRNWFYGAGGAMLRVCVIVFELHLAGSGETTWITKYWAVIGSPIELNVKV